MTKIKILIYTDDMDKWFDEITNEFKARKIIYANKSKLYGYVIETNLFYFEITSKYSETARGKRNNVAIIDKAANKEAWHRIQMNTCRPVIETSKYYSEMKMIKQENG